VTLGTGVDVSNTSYYVVGNVNSVGCSISVDIVPYVTAVTTSLSQAHSVSSTFNRSATGRYPVRENETVYLGGFNLGTPTVSLPNAASLTTTSFTYTATLAIGSANITTPIQSPALTAGQVVYFSASTTMPSTSEGFVKPETPFYILSSGLTTTNIQVAKIQGGSAVIFTGVGSGVSISCVNVNIGAVATSGTMTVSLSPMEAANNKNTDSRDWHKQANGVNNENLKDNLAFYVWRLNSVTGLTSTDVRFPVMRVNPAAAQNVVFAYASAINYYAINVDGTQTYWQQSYNRWRDVGLAYDNNNHYFSLAGTQSSGGAGATANGWTNSYWNGSPNFYFFSWQRTTATVGADTNAYSTATNLRSIESNANSGTTSSTERDQNPKVASRYDGVDTNDVYMTYYDSLQDQVRFRWGTVSSTAANTIGGNIGNQPNSGEGSYAGYHQVASSVTTYKSGQYSAVGVTSTGIAVVAWYDATNRALMYSYAGYAGSGAARGSTTTLRDAALIGQTIPAGTQVRVYSGTTASARTTVAAGPDGTGQITLGAAVAQTSTSYTIVPISTQWQANATVLDSNFAGWYVDLAVDGHDGIHIAYYNSGTGDLKYAKLADYASAWSATICTVDSYNSTGSNIMINTKYDGANEVPYISYYMPSFAQSLYSVHIAWRADFSGSADGASTDKYTGTWEVMTIPETNVPAQFTISNGFKTIGSATNSPIVGYITDPQLRTAQLK
jgi:large repetitive protein